MVKKRMHAVLAAIILCAVILGACGTVAGEPAKAISLEERYSVTMGETKDIFAVIDEGLEDRGIVWNNDAEDVLSIRVRSSILPHRLTVTGLKAGTATITATASNGDTAVSVVEVTAATGGSGDDVELDGTLSFGAGHINLKVGEQAGTDINTDSDISYTSTKPSVATVDGEGRITGVSEGVTYIVAVAGGQEARLKVGVTDGARKSITFGEEADAKTNRYGRNYYNSAAGAYMFPYTAAGFEVAFYGSELKAELTGSSADTALNHISVWADGGSLYDGAEGAAEVKMVSRDKREYTLISGLEPGYHTVRVFKRTAHARSDIQNSVMGVVNVSTDGYFGYPPDKPALKIEVYGDSITCGYGNLTDGKTMTSENTDGLRTFSVYAARELGAQVNALGHSGWGMYRSYWNQTDYTWLNYYNKLSPFRSDIWDFESYQPDIVVINLGTNDTSGQYGESIFSYEGFKQAYISFLGNLRTVYADAYIICTYGMMDVNADAKRAIEDAVAAKSDAKMSYLIYKSRAVSGHPLVSAHKNAGTELADKIKSIIN